MNITSRINTLCFLLCLSMGCAFADVETPATKAVKNDGYGEFKNLCAYKVYFHVDFRLPNAGTSDFALWEDETYRLRFGPNTAIACYTRSANGIRKCPAGSTGMKAGQLFEACGDDNTGDE